MTNMIFPNLPVNDAATAAGGQGDTKRTEDGPMYGGCFTDLDGHIWEPLWMAVG